MNEKIFSLRWDTDGVMVLDQTLLPTEIKYIKITSIQEMFSAIKNMVIRGAGALSFGGAYGIYLGIWKNQYADSSAFLRDVEEKASYMKSCRPTAVSLSVTADRLVKLVQKHTHENPDTLKALMLEECHKMCRESAEKDLAVGQLGLTLLKEGASVLTHCNTGIYASVGIGSAVAPFYLAKDLGMNIKVYADETRPLLQGARLTAHELYHAGIDVTLICDNMAGYLMQQKKIDAVFVGCDRIAANGDTVNKIGTYSVAVLAKHHNIPFYVFGATEDVDFSIPCGAHIPIEQRSHEEVDNFFGKRTAPEGVPIYNPGFDVTPNEFITAIILETGMVYPCYQEHLKQACKL